MKPKDLGLVFKPAFIIKRRRKMRSLTLRVKAGKPYPFIVASIPYYSSKKQAYDFMASQTPFLKQQLTKTYQATKKSLAIYGYGKHFILQGETLNLIFHKISNTKKPYVKKIGQTLNLYAPTQEASLYAEMLLGFLQSFLHKTVPHRLASFEAKLGVCHKKYRLYDGIASWGLCREDGTLSFNWRLVMTPPFVLDYIIAHEATHLKHPNHSKRFWGELYRVLPKNMCDEAQAWLKQNQHITAIDLTYLCELGLQAAGFMANTKQEEQGEEGERKAQGEQGKQGEQGEESRKREWKERGKQGEQGELFSARLPL